MRERWQGVIERQYVVHCGRDRCDTWEPSGPTQHQAERNFRSEGWIKTAADGWLCPVHAAEYVPRADKSSYRPKKQEKNCG
jgi:hypothetical protein